MVKLKTSHDFNNKIKCMEYMFLSIKTEDFFLDDKDGIMFSFLYIENTHIWNIFWTTILIPEN